MNYFVKCLMSKAPWNLLSNKKRSICISSGPLNVNVSAVLWGEPVKKRRRLDPAILRAREERKKRKLEKAIRLLQKNALTLKPIEEMEIPACILDPEEKIKRIRPQVNLTPEVKESRILLEKNWSRYKNRQFNADLEMIHSMMRSQEQALNQLRLVSEELYQAALQLDEELMPFSSTPPTRTPSIDKYDSPDGDYTDISKKW